MSWPGPCTPIRPRQGRSAPAIWAVGPESYPVDRSILTTRKGAVMRPAKIVVGTDGSPSGTSAVRWAAGAAEREGRPLEIVVAYHWQVPGRWYGSVSDVMA